MVEVNWDDVANEAYDSPRGLILEVLGLLDGSGIQDVIILTRDESGQLGKYHTAIGTADIIAMLEFAKWLQCQVAWGRANPDGD